MNIISLFSGCGGLDLGFKQAGFHINWANENDKDVWGTFESNFPETVLDRRDIRSITSGEIPDDFIGIVGGPPCQSWSEAGARRGIEDARGQVFFEYIRILEDKQPLFFLAENVPGLLFKRNEKSLKDILQRFEDAGYTVTYQLLNANDYGVPQDRKRVIFVGYRTDLNIKYEFPAPNKNKPVLRDAIWDLNKTVVKPRDSYWANNKVIIPNHEYLLGSYSTIYMSRNRVRSWDEPSYTIQASGRHAPQHPQANKMVKVDKDQFIFDPKSPELYRRLSIRECARIQTFPDDFILQYKQLNAGYKMIGNAVPVEFARQIADKIHHDMCVYTQNNLQHELSKMKLIS